MKTLDLVLGKRDDILAAATKRGVRNVRVFGSVARGEDDDISDVDFLVDLEEGRGLFSLGGLVMDLRVLLGRGIDVATPEDLKPRIKERVLKEAIPL